MEIIGPGTKGHDRVEGDKAITLPVTPFPLGMDWPREVAGGQPAASVPCGWTEDGLPVGLQIVGKRFDDLSVLKAAAAFEGARPWRDKWPKFE